jgi:hypothetical protein
VNLQMVGFVYGFSVCSVYLCPGGKMPVLVFGKRRSCYMLRGSPWS